MTTTFNQEDIAKVECRYAIHVPERSEINPDIHYIKEVITLKDGTKHPNIRLIKDYQRPLYITKPAFRNHKEKKEFEDLDKLHELTSTESKLNTTIATNLQTPHLSNHPKELRSSPYIYGADVTSSSHVKLHYLNKNKFIQSTYSVAVLDIETGVNANNKGLILMVTITMPDKIYTGVLESFVKNSGDVNYRVKNGVETYLPKYKDTQFKLEVFKTEVEMLKAVFKVANDWAPDFLTIWNMDYDIPFILETLKKHNVKPIDVLADTSIPRQYRYCFYKQGIKKKVTASGVFKPINPALQWHTLFLTAKFYVIDSMCVYKQIRMNQPEESSYSLDSILGKELQTSKLKFKEADEYKGISWHMFMQEKYPVEYIVYNIYDCLSVNELDNKIKDLSNTLPSFAGISDFSKFNSNPKKIADAMYMFAKERGRVIGTVGKKKEEDEVEVELEEGEEDTNVDHYDTLGLKDWIITLPAHLLLYEGLKVFEDAPNIVSNLRGIVFDVDLASGYPSCTTIANVSKETCVNEVISLTGMHEDEFRLQNLGLILGSVNALEYNNVMLKLPNAKEMLSLVKAM